MLLLFTTKCLSNTSKSNVTGKKLKKDVDLFSKLFISAQVRGLDIAEVFKHETRPEPPALSQNGGLRGGAKSDLLNFFPSEQVEPKVDATIFEGSVLVNILRPANSSSFKEYADNVFFKAIKSESQKVDRVDIVFDTYRDNSPKFKSREKRGKRIRKKVENESKTPKDWMSFLRLDQNKTELFSYLSHAVINMAPADINVFCAFDNQAISKQTTNVENISPSTQEKGDTRVFLHVQDAVKTELRRVNIRTVDTVM